MTDTLKLIEELEGLEKKATKGEWEYDGSTLASYGGDDVEYIAWDMDEKENDGKFLALLRNSAPLLLRLARASLELRETLQDIENGFGDTVHPFKIWAHDALARFDGAVSHNES